MTENIPQTSTSERIEQAREALAEYEEALSDHTRGIDSEATHNAINALRALITPPHVEESEEAIVKRLISSYQLPREDYALVEVALTEGVRAGIQSAHETWEPEDRPTQEQMLRWLEIEHDVLSYGQIYIAEQYIEREEI